LEKDEMARERLGHLFSHAKAKKMKSLTLHTHEWLRVSSRDCSSSFSSSSPVVNITDADVVTVT